MVYLLEDVIRREDHEVARSFDAHILKGRNAVGIHESAIEDRNSHSVALISHIMKRTAVHQVDIPLGQTIVVVGQILTKFEFFVEERPDRGLHRIGSSKDLDGFFHERQRLEFPHHVGALHPHHNGVVPFALAYNLHTLYSIYHIQVFWSMGQIGGIRP